MNSATADVSLVVLHDPMGRLRELLTAEAQGRVCLAEHRALTVHTDERGLERVTCTEFEAPIVSLPVDGPEAAAVPAVIGVLGESQGAMVAPAAAGGAPPPWWSLDLTAGIERAAIDLRCTGWHDGSGLWWTDRTGPVWLPLRVDATARARAAASLLRALHETVPADSVGRWLDGVATGRTASDPTSWNRVLCANYVQLALAHLTRPLATAQAMRRDL